MEIKFKAPTTDRSICRVFTPGKVTQFNLIDLNRFGHQILPILDRHTIYPDEAEMFENSIEQEVNKALFAKRFNPNLDYIALVGDALLQAVVLASIGQALYKVRLLRYDGQTKAYWPFNMMIKEQ